MIAFEHKVVNGEGKEVARDYTLIRGAADVAILHVEPAVLGGFIVRRVSLQGQEDWPGMSADEIAQYIEAERNRGCGRDADPYTRYDAQAVAGMLARYESRMADSSR